MPDNIGTSGTTTGSGEDAFFILRDARELFQRRLVEVVQRSGIRTPAVIDAFSRELEAAYDELAASAKRDGFEQTNGLTASRISLVGNDDLELEIRIGDLINRLKGNERIDRWRVQLRYMTLLDRPKMAAENNPAGLEPISRGLWAICRAGNANLDQNLDCLDRLEEQLQTDLPGVYLELNSFLERRGIAPTAVRPIQRGSGGVQQDNATSGSREGAGHANAFSALQQTLSQRVAEDASPGNASGEPSASAGASNAALNASTLTMLNHLMQRLVTLESKQVANQTDAPLLDTSEASAPLRTIRSRDLDLPLGKPAAVALDTLSMIFDAIFSTPSLAEVVKAIIGRLQIPLLRIAILDSTFFTNTQHPARQLINRLAHAAFGLAEDVGRDHPTCREMAKLTDEVRAALDANDGNLKPYLDRLDRLIEERDQSIQTKSLPYMQLVLEHEKRQSAKEDASVWLRDVLTQCAEPSIRRFLSDHWIRVMQSAAEEGGPAGKRWQEVRTTIEDLLWSIQPRQTPEERKRLVALVPTLLKRLNTELDAMKVSTEDRAPFLNACFDLQTAALRNRPDLSPPTPKQPHNPPPTESLPPTPVDHTYPPSLEILERDGKLVQYLGTSTARQTTWHRENALVQPGNWLAFRLPGEEMLCGRLCGEATPSGTVLLFNSDWGYAVAVSRMYLAQQLKDGNARDLSVTALFDDAAERALAQLGMS